MLASVYRLLASVKLSVVLVLLLALLTYLGTVAQVDKGLFEAQRLYFDSWYVLHPVRDVRVPLPGAHAVLAMLFLNLLVGGFWRMRRTWRLAGVYITHVGIAVMLVAGFVKLHYADEGYLSVWEGRAANFFESHYHCELAIARGGDVLEELVVPESVLAQARGQRVKVENPALPFELTVDAYAQNAEVILQTAAGAPRDLDYADGLGLTLLPNSLEREADRPGIYLSIRDKSGAEHRQVLWVSQMLAPQPWSVTIDGQAWWLDLRKERQALPFKVELVDFRKEDHPGTSLARFYESDVMQITGKESRKVKIEMNKPLRDEGFILFQSNWGPQQAPNPSAYYSTFAVVRNPSDQWPLISCGIIAAGLAVHFLMILARYISRQGAAA